MNRSNDKPAIRKAEEPTMDDALDKALRQHFRAEPEVADDGFSHRLMAVLPPQPRPRNLPLAEWALRAQWVAMALAAGALAALHASGNPPAAPQAGAAYALIGLLVFWSLPLRWARG